MVQHNSSETYQRHQIHENMFILNIVHMSSHVTDRTRFSSYAIIQHHDCWTPFSIKSDLDDEGLIQFEMFFTHVLIQNLFFSTDTNWYSEESEHVSLCNPVFHWTLKAKLKCCFCCTWAFAFDLGCLWYSGHISVRTNKLQRVFYPV